MTIKRLRSNKVCKCHVKVRVHATEEEYNMIVDMIKKIARKHKTLTGERMTFDIKLKGPKR